MTDALALFLRARFDKDAQVAQGHQQASASWHADDFVMEVRDDANAGAVATVYRPGDLTHIARHDPARVLAEIDAKRQAVDACAYFLHDSEDRTDPCAQAVLAALALPYRDHPDYRPDWAPDQA